MFTGIVHAKGTVHAARRDGGRMRLLIGRNGWDAAVAPGDSVCVGGVCLTHAPHPGETDVADHLAFDVVAETLACTTLGKIQAGDPINLEPSLTPQTPMGGHVVQGHVDGTGTVRQQAEEPDWRLTIDLHEALMDYVVPKGSITVEGVSLTVAAVEATGFQCALIDTTLRQTTLRALRAGDPVNIETDILSRTVVHWLQRQGQQTGRPGVTAETLHLAGFGTVNEVP